MYAGTLVMAVLAVEGFLVWFLVALCKECSPAALFRRVRRWQPKEEKREREITLAVIKPIRSSGTGRALRGY